MHLPLYVLRRELLQTATAADFYTVMAQLGERLRKAQMLPSPEFMQVWNSSPLYTQRPAFHPLNSSLTQIIFYSGDTNYIFSLT
jgi:hypothetical protein